MKICVTHTSPDRLKNDLSSVIKEHKLWQCEYVGIGAMPSEYRNEGAEGYKRFVKDFNIIAKNLKSEGLKFAYHNHKFEFEKFDYLSGMDILFNESDQEAFTFIIDTYWVQAGGANPIEWIKKVNGRMGVVHFKDMAIKNDEQIFAEVGEGNLNWDKIIKTCEETKVKWHAVEQDICLGDPFYSLEKSFKFLQKYVTSN